MTWSNEKYTQECARLLHSIGDARTKSVFAYPDCEYEPDFCGFLQNYKDIAEQIPKGFTIFDMGCYLGLQADYYKDHARYYGIEYDETCRDYVLRQDNAEYFFTPIQDFIQNTLPRMVQNGLDLNKCFAICSGVPDREAVRLVEDTFPYYRIAYPMVKTKDVFPKSYKRERPHEAER